MKKWKITLAAGAAILMLSACGQTESAEETQENTGRLVIEKIDETDETQKTETSDSTNTDSTGSNEQELTSNPQDEQEPIQNPQIQTEEVTDESALLYEAFLKNEISVANPYVEGMNLTVMDDKNYESEFEDATKKYAYVDVNSDDNPELIFKISSATSELMYILGVCDNELTCFDVFESHTRNISFSVYDYGLVWEIQNYDGFEMTLYSYTADGQQVRARHFTEENEADIAAHEGEEPEWITLQ